MSGYVKIKSGSYRNHTVNNDVFPLVKQFQLGANGGFVTVNGTVKFNAPKVRIKVGKPTDYELISEAEFIKLGGEVAADPHVPDAHVEDDETVMARIEERFGILIDMTKAVIAGDIRAMIVSGPPGVGKSFGIEKELEKASLFDQIAGTRVRSEVVKGSSSAIGLYQTLYKYSDKGDVLVFDDCDSILFDDVSLNLLKAALDSGKNRRISWNSESNALAKSDIPNSFQFNGSVIFITNLKFDQVRSNKLKDHLEALMSRCHYLDLTLDTMREKFLRVKQIARTGALFGDYNFNETEEAELLEYIYENKNKFREMSLRMALKIADLKKSFGGDKWKALAKTTCMKTGTV